MSETAIGVRQPSAVEPWREPGWQRLWLALRNRTWQSLAVLPAGPGVSLDFALRVSVMLSRTGMLHLGAPIQVADATRLPLARLAAFLDEVRRCADAGDPIILALAALSENPVSLSLAHSADAVMLCVAVEKMQLSDASKSVAQVGASRFIGSVMFQPHQIVTEP